MKYQDWKLGLVEFLKYDSYKSHRQQHPEKEPSWWELGFKNWKVFEKLYQKELKNES